jgi:hypothetical protein
VQTPSQNTTGNPSKKGKEERELQDSKSLPQEDNLFDDSNETDIECDMKAMVLELLIELTDGLERLKK